MIDTENSILCFVRIKSSLGREDFVEVTEGCLEILYNFRGMWIAKFLRE